MSKTQTIKTQGEPAAPLADAVLETSGLQYPLAGLDSYGFNLATGDALEWDSTEVHHGELQVNGAYRLPVQFRARRRTAEGYRCTLHDLSLAEQGTLDEMVQEIERSGEANELETLSYDQIADGEATGEAIKQDEKKKQQSKGESRGGLVALLMVAALVIVAVVVAMLVKGRGTLELHNGTLAGNYVPLSTDADAEVAELLVSEGDSVEAGQPLYRLISRERDAERAIANVQLETALAEEKATEKHLSDYREQMQLAERSLGGEIAVANAELKQAEIDFAHAIKTVERLRPLAKSGAIKPIQYDEAIALRDSLGETKKIKQARIDALEISADGLAKGVVIGEGGVIDDRQAELRSRNSVAKAKVSEARKRLLQIESLAGPAAVVAPSAGTVYSLYRSEGEFVKAGSPILSLSGSSAGWALGHIDADQSTKVKPGQRVFVNVPAIGLRAEGRVASVGHRGLYAQGDWSADFRASAPTDVPIKVLLPELPVELPSGIRLNMSVRLDRVWPWQKDTIEVAWPGDGTASTAPLEPGTPTPVLADGRD